MAISTRMPPSGCALWETLRAEQNGHVKQASHLHMVNSSPCGIARGSFPGSVPGMFQSSNPPNIQHPHSMGTENYVVSSPTVPGGCFTLGWGMGNEISRHVKHEKNTLHYNLMSPAFFHI